MSASEKAFPLHCEWYPVLLFFLNFHMSEDSFLEALMAILYNFEIKLSQLFGGVGYFCRAGADKGWELVSSLTPPHVLGGELQSRVIHTEDTPEGGMGRWSLLITDEQNKETGPQNILSEND